MARAKSTTAMGKEHEEFVEEVFSFDNSHRSKSSGAKQHSPQDVKTDGLIIECEATERESLSIKKDTWIEVRRKAHSGKIPAYALRFRDIFNHRNSYDLIALDIGDFAYIYEGYLKYELGNEGS